jgi:hypothetical protein
LVGSQERESPKITINKDKKDWNKSWFNNQSIV